ncbi:MAG: UDP-3-O-acyl-N-acetylglucosamine deacetylase [Oligoflexia bacterium]|nr:UDP-3-O-acyl-N-acetylglucosamine deacetylase [Oligoflexia bacterium]
MLYQKTISHAVEVKGIGLHTGAPSSITFKPAPPDAGVYFFRQDISGLPSLKASSRNVKATQMATVLGGELFAISTVEHCMSAVSALQIDNLHIEMTGPEIPIGDGSANPFFEGLKKATIIEQNALRRYFVVKRPIYFSQGDKHAYIVPHYGFKVSCTIEFPHPSIGKQKIELEITQDNFEKELSQARTFGFLKDVKALQAKGLALGGSLENAVVLNDEGVLNPEGLRFEDEFVRHKAMDAVGDLTMLGYPIIGHVVLHKAGHDLMHRFVEHLIGQTDCYDIMDLESPLNLNQVFSPLYPKAKLS